MSNTGEFEGPVEVGEALRRSSGEEQARVEEGQSRARTCGQDSGSRREDRKRGQVHAEAVPDTSAPTLKGFVYDHTEVGSTVYTGEAQAYKSPGMQHETVKHSVSEYVNGQAYINGVESFWAVLKGAHHGVYHQPHKQEAPDNRYVAQIAGKNSLRNLDTEAPMQLMVAGVVGCRLLHRELVA